MNYINCGNFKTSYEKDAAIYKTTFSKISIYGFLIALFFVPFISNSYILYILNMILISSIAAVGLNILTGFTGLISLGHGAFVGVGAFATGYLATNYGFNFYLAMPLAALITAVIGILFGLPSLRLKDLYLSIATLAAQFILEFIFIRAEKFTGGVSGMAINPPTIFGIEINNDFRFYFFALISAILLITAAKNIIRTKIGRAFISIRDNYIAAEAMGVDVFRYKLFSFGISSFYAGIAGSLWAYYVQFITPEHFSILASIQYLSMIIIGGLGSILGSIFGTIFMIVLPELLRHFVELLSGVAPLLKQVFPAIREAFYGLVIILFLLFEPEGLARRWNLIKAYWKLWPFSY